jgi:hypothetical protein
MFLCELETVSRTGIQALVCLAPIADVFVDADMDLFIDIVFVNGKFIFDTIGIHRTLFI